MPNLGDALRNPASGRSAPRTGYLDQHDDDDIGSNAPPREESYSRSRRSASRSRQPERLDTGWLDETESSALPPSRSTPRRSGPPAGGRARRASERTAPNFGAVTSAFAQAGHQERNIATLVVLGLLSTILMSATLASRISGIADWLPIHFDAAGNPDSFGTASTLWRIPVLAMMSTIVTAALAWVSARREPLGVTVAFVAVVLMQVICWVAFANLAW